MSGLFLSNFIKFNTLFVIESLQLYEQALCRLIEIWRTRCSLAFREMRCRKKRSGAPLTVRVVDSCRHQF
jgi:hypothetical protein